MLRRLRWLRWLLLLLLLGTGSNTVRELTFSSGFGCDSVRDAQGSRAADAGAPPWYGATWTARMGSAVSEIRCQTKTSDQIMSAAEFSRIREHVLVVALQRTVLGSGAASGFAPNCGSASGFAPNWSAERSAVTCGRQRGARAPIPVARALWLPCQCALRKVVAPAIILKQLEPGRWRHPWGAI